MWLILEWIVVLLIAWVYITQIAIPALHGRKWFPMFRKRQVMLEEHLREVKSEAVESNLEDQIVREVQPKEKQ